MNLSNLSKIEVKNSSINSSCKSASRFEEQKDMIKLLDNQLNVRNIFLRIFFLLNLQDNKRSSSLKKNKSIENGSSNVIKRISSKKLNHLRKKSAFCPYDIEEKENCHKNKEEEKNNSIKKNENNFDDYQNDENDVNKRIIETQFQNQRGIQINNNNINEKLRDKFKGVKVNNNENNKENHIVNNVIHNYFMNSNNNINININNNNVNESSNDNKFIKNNNNNREQFLNNTYNNNQNVTMNIRNVNFQNNFDISRLSLMKNINNSFNNFHYLNSPNDLNMNLSSILNSINEKDLFENCAILCKEQLECRILQKKLDENPSFASDFIYNKIKDKFYDLSLDQFGNYFIQKVIEYLNIEHIKELLYQKIPAHFRYLCFNQHGTRVVQKLLEKIIENEEFLNYFISLLTPNLKDFIVDQNANHIIIKYINMVPTSKINFIVQFIIDNIFELSKKKHSCCVLQKCIECSDQEQKKRLLKAIAFISLKLLDDQYGNYVIQYCLNVCDYEINKIIANNFLNDFVKYSTEKYSSNVIEKCLDCCDEETKELIVMKCCDVNIIRTLLFDVYGNYVLQKVILLTKEPIRSQFIHIIGPLMNYLQFYAFGPKLSNKLLTSFPELAKFINGGRGEENKYKKRRNKMLNRINNNNNMNINSLDLNTMHMNNFNVNNINHMNNIYNNAYIISQMNQNNLNPYNNYNQIFNNNPLINRHININNINNMNFIQNNTNLINNNNNYNQMINSSLFFYNNNAILPFINNDNPSKNMNMNMN